MQYKVDKSFYHKTALLKAAYSFIDKAYIHLSQSDDSYIISWKNKGQEIIQPEEIENELIEQGLRFTLIQEHEELRKILLARALASTIIEKPTELTNTVLTSDENPGILESWYTHDKKVKDNV